MEMSLLKSLKIAHLPDDLLIHIALYDDVKNAAFLQQQLLDGNTAFEYAFLDASVLVRNLMAVKIISSTHLLAAVFRAAHDWTSGRLKSKNVHSEIVFCFSMNNNIVESFRRFGISSVTTSLYAVKLSTASSVNVATIEQHLSESIQGNPLPFEEANITKFTDVAKVRKIYKLTDAGRVHNKSTGRVHNKSTGKGGKRDTEGNEDARMREYGGEKERVERKELEIMVLGLMALRGAT
ncbi:MAG: hypothetical protein Q9211_005088 [Gyalolechia sp. 1 TL-2023]